MGRARIKTEAPILTLEPMCDRVCRHPFTTALAGDDVGSQIEREAFLGTLCSGKLLQGLERLFQVFVQRDGPAAVLALAGDVLKGDGIGDTALGIGDHLPCQCGNLLGSEPRFDGQEENYRVPPSVPGRPQILRCRPDLGFRKDFCLLASSGRRGRAGGSFKKCDLKEFRKTSCKVEASIMIPP